MVGVDGSEVVEVGRVRHVLWRMGGVMRGIGGEILVEGGRGSGE